jgi:hypothetical protein
MIGEHGEADAMKTGRENRNIWRKSAVFSITNPT